MFDLGAHIISAIHFLSKDDLSLSSDIYQHIFKNCSILLYRLYRYFIIKIKIIIYMTVTMATATGHHGHQQGKSQFEVEELWIPRPHMVKEALGSSSTMRSLKHFNFYIILIFKNYCNKIKNRIKKIIQINELFFNINIFK